MNVNNIQFQFETLATLYEDMANWPFRKDIERPAVLDRLGNISGLNILDFGCGSGHYSRLLKSQGAARVVGYDVAGGMLQYAKTREQAEHQGIEYVSDLTGLTGQFDLVLAVYVLPYASTRTDLINMVKSMVILLRPGGRLLTLPLNPDYASEPSYYISYGFQLTSDTPHQDGTEVYLRLLLAMSIPISPPGTGLGTPSIMHCINQGYPAFNGIRLILNTGSYHQ